MLTFPIASVRDVIARGRADAEANGGFRNPYCGLTPGKDEEPGLWLVEDHGVYVLSNGKLAGGEKLFVSLPRNAIRPPTSAGRSVVMTVSISSMSGDWRR
jgi:hypothetical protein